MSIAEVIERYEERVSKIFNMAVEALQKQKSSAIEKIRAEEKAEASESAATVSVREVAHELEVPFENEEDYETTSAAEAATPPEPVSTKPRPISSEGVAEGGKISKSKLIREFFAKHPDAANKDLIEFYKKKNIEIKPALVSTVKIKMESTTKRKRGRPAKSEQARAAAVASAKRASKKGRSKRGLPMPACLTKVMKTKHGMQIDEIVKGVKKYYNYRGTQGDAGLKNVVNQVLNSLSKAKPRRGWKSDAPVILHDGESHTWRLNPKAERKTA